MAKVNASIPQGTRDFGPETVRKRNYIFDTIRTVFELYGFQPLETPAMENIETLMGKYGEEGDKLIYRVLDSGNPFTADFFKGLANFVKDFHDRVQQLKESGFQEKNPFAKPFWEINPENLELLSKNLMEIPELRKLFLPKFKNVTSNKALRYDLTIPFARYVAMNYSKLTLPYKRYQIQPVWRADRPQKGRYREFYQCDADVVGSNSFINEVEIILVIDKVYSELSNYFSEQNEHCVTISINNRKIWAGIAELCGCPDKITDITVALDKYDKIGKEGVKEELISKGFNEEQTHAIFGCLFPEEYFYTTYSDAYINSLNLTTSEKDFVVTLYGNFLEYYAIICCLLSNFKDRNIEVGISGVKEIIAVISPFFMDTENFILKSSCLHIDSTLARGLNYYTGTIIEVKAPSKVKIGSIGGGGRYDDLTGTFGVPNVPGVGISFGVDRIYDVMEELKLFPPAVQTGTQVLFFNLGEAESKQTFGLMQALRSKGIRSEMYHEPAKFDKQFKYAEKKNIGYAVIIGSKELADNTCTIKNLRTSTQETISQQSLAGYSF